MKENTGSNHDTLKQRYEKSVRENKRVSLKYKRIMLRHYTEKTVGSITPKVPITLQQEGGEVTEIQAVCACHTCP